MTDQTLDQKRAHYALHTIRGHRTDPDTVKREYATLVRSVPSMVLNNGLGQALAFLLARAEGNHEKPAYKLYKELQEWLYGLDSTEHPERVYHPDSQQSGAQSDPLITKLMAGSRAEYQHAQHTALLLLSWMRKFADAYLPKGHQRSTQLAQRRDQVQGQQQP